MRLTEKDITYITSGANVIETPNIIEGHKFTGQAIIKLGQLEDIEDELGIDLTILFKALKQGIYTMYQGKMDFMFSACLSYEPTIKAILVRFSDDTLCCELSDYGKTWALTKEELL